VPLAYLPTPVAFDRPKVTLRRLSAVEGEVFGVVNNGWNAMNQLAEFIDHELQARGATSVLHFRTPMAQRSPTGYMGEISAKIAGAITGLGN
jgi:hypothetical protein